MLNLQNSETLNPHLHLLLLDRLRALKVAPANPLQRIHHLAKTRCFDNLMKEVLAASMNYPNLATQLEAAKEQTRQEKMHLHDSEIDKFISQIGKQSVDADQHDITVNEGQTAIYRLAKIYYDQGNYQKAFYLLSQLQKQDLTNELWLKSIWGRLYCKLMLGEESSPILSTLHQRLQAVESLELDKVKGIYLEQKKLIKLSYARREEFLYCCLFSLFQKPNDECLEKFVDLCTDNKPNFSVLQLVLPYFLRYITVAIILNKSLQTNRAFDLFKLVETISRKLLNYEDPIVGFIDALYVSYDFNLARLKLQEMKISIREDIFLAGSEKSIIENSQFLYFKVYCKVQESVSLPEIAKFCGKTQEEAQLWILQLIRSANIDAKINEVTQTIIPMKCRQNKFQKYINIIPNLKAEIARLQRFKE